MLKVAAAGASLALALAGFATAETIWFSPGPMDGVKVITPWGDFLAVSYGDHVWVGTEKEYFDAQARGIFWQEGAREFCEHPGEHCNSFISKALPSVPVGPNEVASITTSTLFGVGASTGAKRPPKPAGSEYVQVSWVQRQKQPLHLALLDRTTHRAQRVADCGTGEPFRYCEFIVCDSQLKDPAALVFTSPGSNPGVIFVRSLAWQSYDTIHQHVAELRKSGITVNPNDHDDDSFRYARRLHQLDAEIPANPN